MKVLVFLEHAGGSLQRGAAALLARAARLTDGRVAAVLAGPAGEGRAAAFVTSSYGVDPAPDPTTIDDASGPVSMDALAVEAGRFGAAKVYLARAHVLSPPLPQPHVDVVEQVVVEGGYDTVFFSNSVLAADVASGLAARLGAGLNWDLVDLATNDGGLTAKRLALQDSTLVDVAWSGERRVGLFRAGAFDLVPIGDGIPQIEEVAVDFRPYSVATVVRSRRMQPKDGGPSVEQADVIVAGGMGLGAAENFALAEELARELGGMVGATRAVVYAGWYPRAAQIGQTGKTVAPKLYVGLGVSGAVQHKVGMQGSKLVVAINKDPSAAIFDASDLAVVGDVQVVVPQLIELLRQRKGS